MRNSMERKAIIWQRDFLPTCVIFAWIGAECMHGLYLRCILKLREDEHSMARRVGAYGSGIWEPISVWMTSSYHGCMALSYGAWPYICHMRLAGQGGKSERYQISPAWNITAWSFSSWYLTILKRVVPKGTVKKSYINQTYVTKTNVIYWQASGISPTLIPDEIQTTMTEF